MKSGGEDSFVRTVLEYLNYIRSTLGKNSIDCDEDANNLNQFLENVEFVRYANIWRYIDKISIKSTQGLAYDIDFLDFETIKNTYFTISKYDQSQLNWNENDYTKRYFSEKM